MKFQEACKVALKSRSFWLLSILSLLEVLAIVLISLLNFRITSVNVPVHYSSFANNFFSEPWYYLISFPLFAVAVFVVHFCLAVKMVALDKKPLVVLWQVLGVLILFIALVIFLNIFSVIHLRLQL